MRAAAVERLVAAYRGSWYVSPPVPRSRIASVLSALALALCVCTRPVAAGDSDAEPPPERPPLSRSVVCPVLYAHEVVSQPVMRRFLVGLLGAGYHPQSLAAVDEAMSGLAATPRGCVVLTFDDG